MFEDPADEVGPFLDPVTNAIVSRYSYSSFNCAGVGFSVMSSFFSF
jgi:hypothetical protein